MSDQIIGFSALLKAKGLEAAVGEVKRLRTQLAERDALLKRSREFVAFVHKCCRKNKEYAPLHWQEMVELDRDLSASAEPSVPVERDERAEFENHPRFKGMDFTRSPFHSGYYESPHANSCWGGWQARAALDKATEGASHE